MEAPPVILCLEKPVAGTIPTTRVVLMKPKMVARMGLLFLVGWLAVPADLIAADKQPKITSIQIEHNSVTVVASVPGAFARSPCKVGRE